MSSGSSFPLYRLLATGVAGRNMTVVWQPQEAARSYTDGTTIYLPAGGDTGAQRNAVLVQAALVAAGSLRLECLRSLIGRQETARRYLFLEVRRAVALLSHRLPRSLTEHDAFRAPAALSVDARHSLQRAKSKEKLPPAPEWFGVLRPLELTRRAPQGGTPALDDHDAEIRKDDNEREDEWSKVRALDGLSAPVQSSQLLWRFLKMLLDLRSEPDAFGASAAGGGETSVAGRLADHRSTLRNGMRSVRKVDFPIAASPASETATYAEWDVNRRAYRPNWTAVTEVDPDADDAAGDTALPPAAESMRLQRSLATLCLDLEPHCGQRQGDDYVLDDLIRHWVDTRCGHSEAERFYQAKLRTGRDLGVLILLDMSSSTLEAEPSGERMVDRQLAVAVSVLRAFNRLGDRVAFFGYHSWGRHLVRVRRIKRFDEAMGAAVMQRLRTLRPCGYTRTGAAVRHAERILARRSGTPYRLLLLISDGRPYDDQYEGAYAAADTRRALAEAQLQGTACLCVGVGGDVDKAGLAKVYGEANYLSIPDRHQVLLALRRGIQDALKSTLRRRVA